MRLRLVWGIGCKQLLILCRISHACLCCRFIPAEYVPVNYGGLSRLNDTEFSGVEAPASDVIVKAGEKSHIEIPVTEVRPW